MLWHFGALFYICLLAFLLNRVILIVVTDCFLVFVKDLVLYKGLTEQHH